jgi:hypothetical protein
MPDDPPMMPTLRADLSMATLAAVYRRLLPWAVGAWVASMVLPGQGAHQALLALGASPFFGAATARGLGLHPRWNVASLAVQRAFSHLTALLVLFALGSIAAAVGGTLGGMAASAVSLPDDRLLALPLAVLASLPILWWHWPVILLAYLAPEQVGRGGGRAWRGPGYGDARRLVRLAGPTRRSVLLLAFLYLWVAVLVIAGDGARDAALGIALRTASYLVVLPLVLTWAGIEILEMMRAAGNGGGKEGSGGAGRS